jgi:hypothetical protein
MYAFAASMSDCVIASPGRDETADDSTSPNPPQGGLLGLRTLELSATVLSPRTNGSELNVYQRDIVANELHSGDLALIPGLGGAILAESVTRTKSDDIAFIYWRNGRARLYAIRKDSRIVILQSDLALAIRSVLDVFGLTGLKINEGVDDRGFYGRTRPTPRRRSR